MIERWKRARGLRVQVNDVSFGQAIRHLVAPGNPDLDRIYADHPIVHGAVRLASQMAGSVPFRVVREDRKASGEKSRLARETGPFRARDAILAGDLRAPDRPIQRVENHPLASLFEAPGDSTTVSAKGELFVSLAAHMFLDGQALLVFGRKGFRGNLRPNEVPAEVTEWRLEGPDDRHWIPIRDVHGIIERWEYRAKPDSQKPDLVFLPHEVCYFRFFNPYDRFWGLSPVKSAREELRQDFLARGWNAAFFENGAEPGVILETDSEDLDKKEVNAILKQWDARHKGVAGHDRTALLTHGMKANRSPVTHRDMEFGELRTNERDLLLAALVVHKAAIGFTDQLNRATIQEARRMIWTNLLLPMFAYVEDRLFAHLFQRFDGGKLWGMFDVSGVEELQKDMADKAQALKTMVSANVPYNRAIEAVSLGLPREPWGDTAYVAVNLVPIDTVADPLAVEENQQAGKAAAPTGELRTVKRDRQRELNDFWRAVADDPEGKLFKKLRRFWFELRKEALGNLETATRKDIPPDAADFDPFDSAEWGQRLVDLMDPIWTEVAERTNEQVSKTFGIAGFDLSDPQWQAFVSKKKIRVVGVTDRVKEFIREQTQKAINGGESVTDLQVRLRRTFNSLASPARRLRIARTETGQVANGARITGFRKDGMEAFDWLTARDSEVRESHFDFEGAGSQPWGTNWIDLSASAQRGTLMYPQDISGPPGEVVNCRCLSLPSK